MVKVLVTGMSGTGKTTVIEALAARGHRAVETDEGDWREWRDVPAADGSIERDWVWREDRIQALLDDSVGEPIFLSGTVSNQGALYPQFDLVVLLSASPHIMLERIERRSNNPYGKRPEERAEILLYLETVEPLLRASAHAEIDTSSRTVDEVVEAILSLTGLPSMRI